MTKLIMENSSMADNQHSKLELDNYLVLSSFIQAYSIWIILEINDKFKQLMFFLRIPNQSLIQNHRFHAQVHFADDTQH